jgi:hypothetical protein
MLVISVLMVFHRVQSSTAISEVCLSKHGRGRNRIAAPGIDKVENAMCVMSLPSVKIAFNRL